MTEARILIVDDEPAMLRTLERILGAEHRVFSTTSPAHAIELAAEFKPHLAIVDIRMEGMDGFELMNVLKRRDRDVQVILMTGSVYDIDEELVRAIREKAFYYVMKPFDREVLRALVHRCLELQALEDADRRHVKYLESQLHEARAFQETLLPAPEARIEGFEIHAFHRPCEELAGDLYDYAAAGRGCVALLIADVVGHGVSAAMLTAIVKSAFHSAHIYEYDPLTVVRRVAEGISAFEADRFVTLLAARISALDGTMEYVNAGHEGGLISTPGNSPIPLESTGPLIAPSLPHQEWSRKILAWTSQAMVLLYTDGVPEAAEDDEPFGVERICQIVEREAAGGAGLLREIVGQVEQFTPGQPAVDDMTLLTARIA